MSACPGNAVAALILSTCPLAAAAEVVDMGDSGFTTRHSLTVSAARDDVYRTAVQEIDDWWSGDHTVSGRADNLRIDARPGGCFCERLGEGAGVVHMTVTFVNPGVLLRLSGGLGPLGLMGVSGNLTWEFAEDEEGTVVTWTYAVGGYLPVDVEDMAGAVDEVLTAQMLRLKSRAEADETAGPGGR